MSTPYAVDVAGPLADSPIVVTDADLEAHLLGSPDVIAVRRGALLDAEEQLASIETLLDSARGAILDDLVRELEAAAKKSNEAWRTAEVERRLRDRHAPTLDDYTNAKRVVRASRVNLERAEHAFSALRSVAFLRGGRRA